MVLKIKDAIFLCFYSFTLPHVTTMDECYFSVINKNKGFFLILQAEALEISIMGHTSIKFVSLLKNGVF